MNKKQFSKNMKSINKHLDREYPGAVLVWNEEEVYLFVPEEYSNHLNEIYKYAEEWVAYYGGEVHFSVDQTEIIG